MLIRYKGISHNCVTDAPFIGARINAIDCFCNCPGCFNQELRNNYFYVMRLPDLIDEVLKYPLDEGIILGGLEWTIQAEEMRALIKYALREGLQVMLYTYRHETEFEKEFPDLIELPIYVKFGEYQKDNSGYEDERYGVVLASANQHIKYYGKENDKNVKGIKNNPNTREIK